MRAMEDREEGRLIVDPLAAQLAGPAAMKMTDDYFKVIGKFEFDIKDTPSLP